MWRNSNTFDSNMHVCGLLQDKLHIQNLHNVQTQGDIKFPLSQMLPRNTK